LGTSLAYFRHHLTTTWSFAPEIYKIRVVRLTFDDCLLYNNQDFDAGPASNEVMTILGTGTLRGQFARSFLLPASIVIFIFILYLDTGATYRLFTCIAGLFTLSTIILVRIIRFLEIVSQPVIAVYALTRTTQDYMWEWKIDIVFKRQARLVCVLGAASRNFASMPFHPFNLCEPPPINRRQCLDVCKAQVEVTIQSFLVEASQP
jgi:hypothetical protein